MVFFPNMSSSFASTTSAKIWCPSDEIDYRRCTWYCDVFEESWKSSHKFTSVAKCHLSESWKVCEYRRVFSLCLIYQHICLTTFSQQVAPVWELWVSWIQPKSFAVTLAWEVSLHGEEKWLTLTYAVRQQIVWFFVIILRRFSDPLCFEMMRQGMRQRPQYRICKMMSARRE